MPGKQKWFATHRLVLAAFVGESKLQANHKNGNPKDNRLCNLEYVTASQNSLHRERVLKRKTGFKPRISDDAVRLIFRMRRDGFLLREIAEKVGCTESNVFYILKRQSRTDVSVSASASSP
jgi:hypothetical protein